MNEFFYSIIYQYKSEIPEIELQNIAKIVDKILINKCEKLSEAIKLFNNEETKKIYEILSFWEESGLVKIFDYDREINWSDRIMGFDLTEYSNKEFIVVPILYYMLYKIEDMLNSEVGSIIVFKNSKQLLNNEIFIDKIVHLLDRLRQKNCVAIFCFDAEDYDNDVKKLLSLVSQKVSSKFILSDFNVNEELKDILKLDDNELRMINYFKDNERKFLLKFGSNSMVANFDLSGNKPLTKLLSSSYEDIAIVEEIFNHAKQNGKIIDNEIAIKQFFDVIETLEQEEISRKQEEERHANLAKMRRARGIS